MSATITAINLAPGHGETQQPATSASLDVDSGLIGDRYAGSHPAVVTFIESEAVAAFNAATGCSITAADTGRNIVTSEVDLNRLIGRRFRVGAVILEGMELCEPCATLGARLRTEQVSASDIVRHFTHSAGIRAFVRSSGEIRLGDTVTEEVDKSEFP